MKLNLLLVLSLLTTIVFSSCGGDGGSTSENKSVDTPAKRMNTFFGGGPVGTNVFIPADSANKMISSYLQSIDSGTTGDSSLHSLIFDADSLRAYLNNQNIKHVKVMFAHTLAYVNAMGPGHNVGYESGAFTLVFGGYDEAGNYVFWQGNKVPDYGTPCPSSCPTVGTAASDKFPINH